MDKPFRISIPCSVVEVDERDFKRVVDGRLLVDAPIEFIVHAKDIDEAHAVVKESIEELTKPEPYPDSQP